MVSKYEPAAFAALQTLFDAVSSATIEAPNSGAAHYFKCLNSINFGDHQKSGRGAQYNGKDADCKDWDYHGQCFTDDAKKYHGLTAGSKTKAVANHKEIYKRKPFCKYDDYNESDDTCANPKSLVVIEMRESDSPIVSGSHNGCTGNLQTFLTTVQKKDKTQRQSSAFNSFLDSLIAHGS